MSVVIPGMASFMEETKIELDVETSDEAVAAENEAVEDVAETAEVTETADDVEEATEEAEMIFRTFDNIERMEAYVNKYGVDRQFLFMNNKNNELANLLGLSLPACESFDVTGDPKSSTSITCCEGFKEAMKATWEFIKKIAAKVKQFVTNLVQAIIQRFTSLEGNIGRLRRMYAERVSDDERLKDANEQVMDENAITKAYAGPTEHQKFLDEADKLYQTLATVVGRVNSSASNPDSFDPSTALKPIDEQVKSISEKLGANKKAISAARGANRVPVKNIGWNQIPSFLDNAEKCVLGNKKYEQIKNDVNRLCDDMVKLAGSLEKMDQEATGFKNACKEVARSLNKAAALMPKIGKMNLWAAQERVSTVAKRMKYSKKK